MNKNEILSAKFNGYVKKSIYFTRLDYIKKQNKINTIAINETYESYSKIYNIENTLLTSIFVKEILTQIKLNEQEKFIILNYYFLNESDPFIAQKLNISKQAVNMRRKNILSKLKKISEM